MILKGIMALLGLLLTIGVFGFLVYLLDKYMFKNYFSELIVRLIEKDISDNEKVK